MNKELYKLSLSDEKIQSVSIKDDTAVFKFESGKDLTIQCYHRQDCCENVYADFSILDYHEELVEFQVAELIIKGVEEMGFLICLNSRYNNQKIFIPCYNNQNGYYSSDLGLIVSYNDVTKKIDITDLVESNID